MVWIPSFSACQINWIWFNPTTCSHLLWIQDFSHYFASCLHQFSMKAQNTKRHLDQGLSDCKWCLNFPSQGLLIPLHFCPLDPGEIGSGGGIYRGQILTDSRIKISVPHHHNLLKTLDRKATQETPQRAASRILHRPFYPLEELIVQRIFILPRPVIPSWVKQPPQPTPMAPSDIVEFITLPDHPMFLMWSTTHTSTQLVTENSRYYSHNQG